MTVTLKLSGDDIAIVRDALQARQEDLVKVRDLSEARCAGNSAAKRFGDIASRLYELNQFLEKGR